MKKIKTKYFASPFIMVGLIVMLFLMFGIWAMVFIAFLQGGNNVTSPKEMKIVFSFVTIVLLIAILTFLGTCHKGFSIFEISEKGVKRSLFKVFRKTEISWNEMHEIRCYGMVTKWLFFSKTSLENSSYNEIIKRKDVLQIEYSEQMVRLIQSFTDKEIIDLPEDISKND